MSYYEKECDSVFSAIEHSDSIVLYGHMNPDGDCVGSVLGLKYALQEIFPDKKIFGVGSRPSNLYFIEDSDEVSLDVITSSLAVMVDLSDVERVEDSRIKKAKAIVAIDHHEKSEEFPFPVLRDTLAPSATFVIAKALLQRYHYLPKKACYYLFLGLVTDSGRFQYDSSEETFEIAKNLAHYGQFDYRDLYQKLYRQKSNDLRFRSFVYANFKFQDKVTYVIVRKEDYLSLGLNEQEAGCQVNLLANLDEHPMWVMFTELEKGGVRVELRSNGKYNVQKVAVLFNGGGHIPASGCLLDSLDDAYKVVLAMNQAEGV